MSFIKKIDQKIRRWNHGRIDFMRSLRLRIFKVFFDQELQNQLQGTPRTIDVLRLDGKIGDSVVSTGFINALVNSFPDCKVRVFANPQNAFLYGNRTSVDVVIVKKGFLNTIRTFLNLKNKAADVLINTTHILSPSSLFLSRFVQAKRKIVFFNFEWKMYSDHIQYDSFKDHITERYRSILRLLNVSSNGDLGYVVHFPKEAQDFAQKSLSSYRQSGRRIVILNSFAGARLRNLNQLTTLSIVRELTEKHNVTVVSIGNEGDLNIVREWQQQHPMQNWISFPNGSFDYNAALIWNADAVITPDTSIVHLACALKSKLVAIYREDVGDEKNSVIWSPRGTHFQIVYAPKPENKNAELDINSASVQEIIDKTNQLLNST